MRHYCLIETGLPPEKLVPVYGSYPEMGAELMAQCLEPFHYSVVSPVKYEPLPPPDAFDGYVIMGSEFSVNNEDPWIHTLLTFIRDVAAMRIPLAGICFGHQLIAKALGGIVESGNYIVGATRYDSEASGKQHATIAYHQDQVVVMPADAELVMSSVDCPVASLRYKAIPCWTIQSHPEFTTSFALDLFEDTRGRPLTDEMCDAAVASVMTLVPDLDPVYQYLGETFVVED